MAKISQEKDLEMLKKNADGSFTKYNPKTKAINVTCANGQSVETQLAETAKKVSEAFQLANSGKSSLVSTIGGPITTSSTFAQINQELVNSKQNLVNQLNAKGQPSSINEALWGLSNKVGNISTGKKFASGSFAQTIKEQIITVDNLNFTPRTVIVNLYDIIYDGMMSGSLYSLEIPFRYKEPAQDVQTANSVVYGPNYAKVKYPKIQIINNGFIYNTRATFSASSVKYVWVAFN